MVAGSVRRLMKVSTYIIRDESILRNCLSELQMRCSESDKIRVRIDITSEPKTQAQLGYLWGLVYPKIKQHLMDNMGQDFNVNEIHDYYISMYCEIDETSTVRKWLDCGLGSNIIHKSLSGYNLEMTIGYIDWLLMTCSEKLGLYVPPPDRFWKMRGLS